MSNHFSSPENAERPPLFLPVEKMNQWLVSAYLWLLQPLEVMQKKSDPLLLEHLNFILATEAMRRMEQAKVTQEELVHLHTMMSRLLVTHLPKSGVIAPEMERKKRFDDLKEGAPEALELLDRRQREIREYVQERLAESLLDPMKVLEAQSAVESHVMYINNFIAGGDEVGALPLTAEFKVMLGKVYAQIAEVLTTPHAKQAYRAKAAKALIEGENSAPRPLAFENIELALTLLSAAGLKKIE